MPFRTSFGRTRRWTPNARSDALRAMRGREGAGFRGVIAAMDLAYRISTKYPIIFGGALAPIVSLSPYPRKSIKGKAVRMHIAVYYQYSTGFRINI